MMEQTLSFLTDSALVLLALVVVVVIAAILLGLLLVSSNKRTLCIGYLLLGFLFEVFMHKQPYIQLGLQIYLNDVISMLVLVCVFIGFMSRPLPIKDPAFLVWLALGGVILMSLVIGIGQFGKYAGTEVRENFYYWVAGLYCCTAEFDEVEIRRMVRWVVWGAYGLIGIAIYRWIGMAVGFVPVDLLKEVGITSEFRALPSSAAFYLAAVGLVQLLAWLRGTGTRWSGWHAFVFMAFVLILQHRSVWIAYGLCVLYLAIQERRFMPRRLPLLGGFFLVAGISTGIAAAFGLMDSLFENLEKSTASMFDVGGTFTARTDGWDVLLDDWTNSSLRTLLLGFPYGYGYRRVIRNIVIEFAPHNFYIDMLLRVGIVGLILMLAATLMSTVHSLRAKTETEFEYLLLRGLGIVLIASLVYYIPYPANYVHGAVTGLALAQIIRHRALQVKRRNDQPRPWRPSYRGRHAR